MSKAGQRILATLAFLLIAGFKTQPAFAQIPLSNVTPTPNQAYICSSQTVSCTAIPANFVFNEASKALPLPKVQVEITKRQDTNLETSSLLQMQIEPKKLPQTPALPIETPPPAGGSTPFIAYAPNDAVVDSNKIQDLINGFRTSIGLTPFLRDDNVCTLAKTRSTELAGELARGVLHSGLYNRNLPYWIWENAKVGSDEAGTVTWWLNSPIHRASIEGNYKYSCGACTGSYCSQLFTNYEPKVTTTALATETK